MNKTTETKKGRMINTVRSVRASAMYAPFIPNPLGFKSYHKSSEQAWLKDFCTGSGSARAVLAVTDTERINSTSPRIRAVCDFDDKCPSAENRVFTGSSMPLQTGVPLPLCNLDEDHANSRGRLLSHRRMSTFWRFVIETKAARSPRFPQNRL